MEVMRAKGLAHGSFVTELKSAVSASRHCVFAGLKMKDSECPENLYLSG
jgi:hypothetical protein